MRKAIQQSACACIIGASMLPQLLLHFWLQEFSDYCQVASKAFALD